MIGIAAPVYDPLGYISIQHMAEGSRTMDGGRRSTRYATLDGGARAFDGGYSSSDQTLVIVILPATRAQVDTVIHMGESYPVVRVSTRRGVWDAKITQWNPSGASFEFEIELLEKRN